MEEGELKRQKTETGSEEEEKKNEEVEEEEEEEEEDGSSENELLLELEELDEQEARVDDSFEEAWDGAHVRMPCSARSLYRRQDGSDATHAKWPLLVQSLVRPIASVAALEKAVNRYQVRFRFFLFFFFLFSFFSRAYHDKGDALLHARFASCAARRDCATRLFSASAAANSEIGAAHSSRAARARGTAGRSGTRNDDATAVRVRSGQHVARHLASTGLQTLSNGFGGLFSAFRLGKSFF
jgi:hypothetical protein